ncbi:MAG: SufD family Fe-S cluster assembly protein [Candidatus Babeliales bacterium]
MNIKKIVVAENTQETIQDHSDPAYNHVHACVRDNATLIYFYNPTADLHEKVIFEFFLGNQAQLFFIPRITHQSLKMELSVVLEKPGADAQIFGYYVLKKQQTIFLTTKQHHQAPCTKSVLVINGVLAGNSRAEYDGSIIIEQHAQASDAAQSNKNLVFDQAHARSEPNLEVKTNNVSCKHGSAVGTLDPEHVFYMQARGLSVQKAQELYTDGFLQAVFDGLPDVIKKSVNV